MGGGRSKSLASAIKDTLQSFLLLTSLVFILGACSDSETSSVKSSACFEFNEDKAQITGYLEAAENGEACPKDVVILDGVTSIAENAFKDQGLTSVEIPESITEIEAHAFDGNSLTSVDIPEGVTSIGSYAFSNNSLTSVDILEGVTSIGEYAFDGNSLTSVTIPDSVTDIGDSAA